MKVQRLCTERAGNCSMRKSEHTGDRMREIRSGLFTWGNTPRGNSIVEDDFHVSYPLMSGRKRRHTVRCGGKAREFGGTLGNETIPSQALPMGGACVQTRGGPPSLEGDGIVGTSRRREEVDRNDPPTLPKQSRWQQVESKLACPNRVGRDSVRCSLTWDEGWLKRLPLRGG